MVNDFVDAVAACLTYPDEPQEKIKAIVRRVLFDRIPKKRDDPPPPPPTRDELQSLQNDIKEALGTIPDKIALVYGGATKIKGYVFEAPKLPEIRGASALLDWVNEVELPKLWGADKPEDFVEKGIIYSSGGNILAFASVDKAQERATAIERLYTDQTLTANSAAVCGTFSLLELRYGRRPLDYWFKEFEKHWNDPTLQPTLAQYYYGSDEDTSADRFYRRKTFGELVTLLATMFNRRRESLDEDGPRRAIPHYQLMPWAIKCAFSDIRPAVVEALTPDRPKLSEPSARKLYIGRKMKRRLKNQSWFEDAFPHWKVEIGDSWIERFKGTSGSTQQIDQRWCNEVNDTSYFRCVTDLLNKGEVNDNREILAAQDVGDIAQASSPKGYIGLIYADGNNVGRRIARTPTPEGYANLSNDLDRASTLAVFRALAQHLQPIKAGTDLGEGRTEERYIHPFEVITIGGDDLILIVPGSKALDIALTIGYEFEYALRQRDPDQVRKLSNRYHPIEHTGTYNFACYTPDIGLSAGVVVAQENAPIFFLRELAEELLKNAKKKAKRASETDGGGAVDFMVMKSITMVTDNITAFREQALGTGAESSMRLIARPYAWAELQGLLETAKALHDVDFPSSQLYRLRQHLFDAQYEGGIVPSVMDYLYTQTRGVSGRDREALLKVFEYAWHQPPRDIVPWICRPTEVRTKEPTHLPPKDRKVVVSGYESLWPDLTEIYDFVAQPQSVRTVETQEED